jgi:predicted small integral membrane protein
MTTDKLIRSATALVVTAVAAFATVVSYSHVFDLGRAFSIIGLSLGPAHAARVLA